MATQKDVEEGKIVAFLAYLLIGIIWFFVDEKMKKNAYVKFHVKQAIVLLIFAVIIGILNAILSTILSIFFGIFASTTAAFTYGTGYILMLIPALISFVIGIIPFIFWIFGVVYSLTGKEKELPLIGRFGKKFNF